MAVQVNGHVWGIPQTAILSGNRLHLHQGPIDLVIKAEGANAEVASAYQAATRRFQTVLSELVCELVLLRQPLTCELPLLQSPIALRMLTACWPHRAQFITPMAAVAGAVADDVLHAMLQESPNLHTAYVNNGGDIACHVRAGQTLRIGMVSDLLKAVPEGVIHIAHSCGVATSGWRGRSFSLGIADAVTVLASSAAGADAAATIIANAVNIEDPAINRQTAQSLDPDSDLGDKLVTTGVSKLSSQQALQALQSGENIAQNLLDKGLVIAAFVALQDSCCIVQSAHAKMLS